MKPQEITALAVAHCLRFRAVSTRYPRRVAEAYRGHGGIAQAARDSDRQVAKMVAAWERHHGLVVREWVRSDSYREGAAARGCDRDGATREPKSTRAPRRRGAWSSAAC